MYLNYFLFNSSIVLPVLSFHSFQPFALLANIVPAAALGELKIWSV
jgi:hypothetical protein